MRARALLIPLVLTSSIWLSAQSGTPAQPAPPAQAPAPTAAPLPVRRVVLYKTGVGYFEHIGTVRNQQDITIRFTSAQLNDVLKSLTAIDLGKGQITGISYNSVAPLEQRLGTLRLPLDQGTTALQLLGTLRGARVEVTTAGGLAEGRLLSVEQRQQTRGSDNATTTIDVFSIMTDAGELRTFDLTPAVRVRVVERDLRQEIGRYLDLVGSTREQDVRSLTLSTAGSGERQIFVSYVSEVPIWKTTYRLVLAAKGQPLLQGWAVVDNTIGEDWRNVELSLVAGAPQSFIQQISQPYYGRRAVVPMPSTAVLTPQTHQATLQGGGAGTVTGQVRDGSGGVMPGTQVVLYQGSTEVASAITDGSGQYRLGAAPGEYRLDFRLPGFATETRYVTLGAVEARQNVAMSIGSMAESVLVQAARPAAPPPPPAPFRGAGGGGGGRGGGIAGGVVGGMADAIDVMRDAQPAATAGDLGDLFEYRIKEPVSLRKNQSALVPIVNQAITAEKVSLWNRTSGSGRPLRALWLTNATGLTLDGGSMTIIDGDAFAGEGLIDALKPAERRLVSYGADLAVLVDARADAAPRRVVRVRARNGILIQDTEERTTTTYKARNEGTTATTLVVEHRMRPGWKLAEGQTVFESTPDTYRFRVTIDSKKEAELVVREMRAGEARVALGDIGSPLIVQLSQSGVPAAALQQALEPLLTKQSEVAAAERRLQELLSQRAAIVDDQQRLRENMKALKGSAEEKQLILRYTRQLDDQETKLEALQKDIASATTARNEARAQLATLISTMSFELAGS